VVSRGGCACVVEGMGRLKACSDSKMDGSWRWLEFESEGPLSQTANGGDGECLRPAMLCRVSCVCVECVEGVGGLLGWNGRMGGWENGGLVKWCSAW
jgi:hypothetical protein